MTQVNRRNLSIDGLKGIAIIAIICYHLFPDAVPGGFLMVNTFFVISGFFFTTKIENILDNWTDNRLKEIGRYTIRTIERLFVPLFWMILLVVAFFFVFNRQALNYIQSDILSSLFFVNNFFQLNADRSYFVQMTDASPFTHLWYNSIYMQSFLLAVGISLLMWVLKFSKQIKAVIWF